MLIILYTLSSLAHCFIISNITKTIPFYRSNSRLNVFIDADDNDEFFDHDEVIEEKPPKFMKNKLNHAQKLHISRPINKSVKTRYKLQQFPKKQGVTKDGAYKFCSNLRICGGSIRGRKLCIPPIYVRPAMAKVKISVFNYLNSLSMFSIDKETNVIDLYCGTGSLGLESLSYGASKCTFVDTSLKCLKAVSLNSEKCNYEDKCRLIRCDSMELISSPHLYNINEKFDLMFVSPPYEEVVYSEILEYISNCNILNKDAIVIVEYPKELLALAHTINDKLFGLKNKKYGRTVIAIYVYNPSSNKQPLIAKAVEEFSTDPKKKKRVAVEDNVLVMYNT
ncbi:Conserved hypothetical protein 95 family protein [Theileria parva strain Muguga]|uniref:Methyltransferase n=1 Tax=Theileria parva TaxID=5875 RepID=Q4N8X1_THEPA|nr:Conserved hypothetical protein 95 family protein [Theileria parva strain Muguga]EAN33587.1 Conserved hypothetical protein 95 family protein [Theileria parva strain Muguga]|eukprot:XP_765870.1 hypothetical protein [Theileria parva strain Muguga]